MDLAIVNKSDINRNDWINISIQYVFQISSRLIGYWHRMLLNPLFYTIGEVGN